MSEKYGLVIFQEGRGRDINGEKICKYGRGKLKDFSTDGFYLFYKIGKVLLMKVK